MLEQMMCCLFSDKITNFQPVTTYNEYFMIFFGFVAFLVQIQFLNVLRYVKSIALMTTTLSSSISNILSFGLLTVLVFTAFTACMTQSFREVEGYETINAAIGTNLAAMLNNFPYHTVVDGTGVAGGAFLIFYVLTMMLIVINFFISMLDQVMAVMKDQKDKWDKDTEVVDHLVGMVKSIFIDKNDDEGPAISKYKIYK